MPGPDSRHVEFEIPPGGTGWLVLGFFLFATAAAFLTARDYGIASDVGLYFHSSLRQIAWAHKLLEAVLGGAPTEALGRTEVFEHWRWLPVRVTHPPLSRELSGLSYLALKGWVDPLTAYRGAVLLTYGALVASVAAVTARATGSRLSGLAAGASTLTIPALFAYGHLAHTDLFLAAFWFWCVSALEAYLRTDDDRWLVASGLLLGAACATKFSGVLLVVVLGGWLLHRRRLDLRATAILAAAAIVVFFAVDPALWVGPVEGIREYLATGVNRSADEAAQIVTEYFGELYVFRAPWHYPFVWTAIVVPIPILLAMAAGLSRWRGSRLVPLTLLNAVVLYGALLVPAAPLHDGIRLFLPLFPFLCVLSGIGCGALSDWITRRSAATGASGDLVGALVFLALFALPGLRTVQYHPHQLSYFNVLIGGIRGAAARGLEVTNLKEALSPSVLAELRERIPPDAVIHGGFLTEELCFYQAVGDAPRSWVVETALELSDGTVRTIACEDPRSLVAVTHLRPPRDADYVFVLNRRAQFTSIDRALTRFGGAPFYKLAVRGVPLLRVYRTE
ncbi:MAG: glycosyltransferase family 39 protein [Gemmatimonadota bacterium]